MPRLIVLGGANGVGKSTMQLNAVSEGKIDPSLPFINVDNIVLNELGGSYNVESVARGEEIAKERMGLLIKEKKDFIIEANLAKTQDYDWIALMRKQGYDTELFFLCTKDVQINKNRVQQRVLEGGHDIPPNIIEHRYKLSLTYLKSKILEFTKVTLIDTSRDEARDMVVLKLGKIEYKAQELEQWAKDSIYIAERLQEKLTPQREQNKLKPPGHSI